MSGLVNTDILANKITGLASVTPVEVGFRPSRVEVTNATTNMHYSLTDGATNIQIQTGSTGVITQSAAAAGVSLKMLANGFQVKSSASDEILYKAIR